MPRINRYEEVPDGYVLWFERSEENMQLVSEFALFESYCCDFLSFGIGMHPGGKEISLRMTGPNDPTEFIRHMLASTANPPNT